MTPFDNPFSGRSDGFSFVTLAETPFAPNAAAMRMNVTLEGDTLLLETELLNDDAAVVESWTDMLVGNVGELTVDYYSDDGNWHKHWSDDTSLPHLIRIRISEGSKPGWPEFTVRPRL
ncbi:type II secretion system protein GspJ [Litoreibacter meonggei]|uniref:type II secretion system protein GspJ n=1 Tax=Litoreibacter meonggei TaxID=1049199 RepID=UPI001FECDAE7|nr:type II secretion system protein GspJ [Litoreibacter meonggei]